MQTVSASTPASHTISRLVVVEVGEDTEKEREKERSDTELRGRDEVKVHGVRQVPLHHAVLSQ